MSILQLIQAAEWIEKNEIHRRERGLNNLGTYIFCSVWIYALSV